jgi:hypothetical protein
MTTAQQIKRFTYSPFRDKCGLCAWRDQSTNRFISRKTLMRRTGLDERHIKSFENGRDGRGYWMTTSERTTAEAIKGVELQ